MKLGSFWGGVFEDSFMENPRENLLRIEKYLQANFFEKNLQNRTGKWGRIRRPMRDPFNSAVVSLFLRITMNPVVHVLIRRHPNEQKQVNN